MSLGKKRRMRRIFKEDGRSLLVPMDHGVTLGPVRGLVNMQEIFDKIRLGNADGVIVHKGVASRTETGNMALLIHLSGSTALGPDPLGKVQVCSVEEAVRLGADGVSVHVNVGAEQESAMLSDLGSVADECDFYGLPLLAMMYPRGAKVKSEHDPEAVKHAARLGAELGADIVKTNYTGSPETFREVVRGCPVPVIVAGGPKAKTDEEVLRMVYDSLQVGGAGVSIGRNIFQHENPTAMVKALHALIHQKAEVDEALKILREKR